MNEFQPSSYIENQDDAIADYESQVNKLEEELLQLISSDGDSPKKRHSALLELDGFNKDYLEKNFSGNTLDRINFHIQTMLVGKMLEELRDESFTTARIENPRKIAKGGMETEWVIASFADDEKQTPLAVKIIKENALSEVENAFKNEQKVLKILQEKYEDNYPPNLLKLFAVGEGVTATERIKGGKSLKSVLKENGSIDLQEITYWVRSICFGLEALYAAGFEAHNDVSPDNCILDDEGIVHLIDFSLVDKYKKRLEVDDVMFGGKLKYLPPEKCVKFYNGGEQPLVDRRSDVYAITVMFYQMITKNSDPYGRNDGKLSFSQYMMAAYGNEIIEKGGLMHTGEEDYSFYSEEDIRSIASNYGYIDITKDNCSLTNDEQILEKLNKLIKKGLSFDPKDRQQSPAFFFQELLEALKPVS